MSNNVQEIMQAAESDFEMQEMLKEAASESILGLHPEQWKNLAMAGAGAAAIQVGGSLGQMAVDKVRNHMSYAKSYKGMVETNPDLAKADSKLVQRTFNTLHTFNPQYAADPMVAGAFVRSIVESARVPMDVINNIVAARKNIESTGGKGNWLSNLPMEMVQNAAKMPPSTLSWEEQRRSGMYDAAAKTIKNQEVVENHKAKNPGYTGSANPGANPLNNKPW